MKDFIITVAGEEHLYYVKDIENAIIEASKVKGTGLAKRSRRTGTPFDTAYAIALVIFPIPMV